MKKKTGFVCKYMWGHLVRILQIVDGVKTHLMDQQRIPTSSQGLSAVELSSSLMAADHGSYE